MSWRALTEADLNSALSGPELASYRALATGAGMADPVQPALDRTTTEVRGYVAGCERNALGEEGTIPLECLGAACDLAAWYIISGLPINDASIVDTRKERKVDAIRFLDRVSKCSVKIAQPITESDEIIPRSSFEQVGGNVRQATRDKMSGI